MDKYYEQVSEFQRISDYPTSRTPVTLTGRRATERVTYIAEELVEILRASTSSDLEFGYAVDALYRSIGEAMERELGRVTKKPLTEQADGWGDVMYYTFGSFVEMGVPPQRVMDAIQGANMSKFFIDSEGRPYAKKRKADGKVMKNLETFRTPEGDIEEYIEQLMKRGEK